MEAWHKQPVALHLPSRERSPGHLCQIAKAEKTLGITSLSSWFYRLLHPLLEEAHFDIKGLLQKDDKCKWLMYTIRYLNNFGRWL